MTELPTSVTMVLASWDWEHPRFPPGLRVRHFVPGDQETWLRIHNEVGTYGEVLPALFWREFGDRADSLPERQLFVVDQAGLAIATATAWFPQPARPPRWGRLHWVAVLPSFQRQGIASALVRVTCARLLELGYTGVYLTTGATNYRAVALYLSLGFRPEIDGEGEALAWDQIARALSPEH